MTDKTFGLDRNEEELLISGISDEALEYRARYGQGKSKFHPRGLQRPFCLPGLMSSFERIGF